MTKLLENLVRPNESTNYRPPPTNPFASSNPNDSRKFENAKLSWGGAGDGLFTWQNPGFGLTDDTKNDETLRKYDVVRVKNKDDPDQYVDTETMTEYQARNAISKQRITLRFAPPEASENTEIISRGNSRGSGG